MLNLVWIKAGVKERVDSFSKEFRQRFFVIFWIQSMGMDAISLTSMGIVMLTGAIPAMIFSKIVEYIILARVKLVLKIGN